MYDKTRLGLVSLGDLIRIGQAGGIKLTLHELARILPKLGIATGPHMHQNVDRTLIGIPYRNFLTIMCRD